MAKATNAIHPLHLYGPELTNRICWGDEQATKATKADPAPGLQRVSDGKYKVSVISGETLNGEHLLQDKSLMLHAFDMTYGLDSILGHKYDPINGVAYRLAAAYGKRGQRVCHIPGK